MTPSASGWSGRSRDGSLARATARAVSLAIASLAIAVALIAPHAARAQGTMAAGPLVDEWVKKPVDDRTFRSFLGFFKYDRALPLNTQVASTVDSAGLRRERVSFVSTAGTRVTAILVQQLPLPTARRPAIVFLHGGTRRGKDAPGYVGFTEYLARAGFRVLSIDFPEFGERATGLLTSFTEEDKHEKLYNQPATFLAWVTQSVKDAGRAIDFLVAERNTDSTRVVLVGQSRGGQMALIIGGAEMRFRGVVAMSAGHMDHFESGHLPAACPANYIGRISPRPLYTVNGTSDADYSRDSSVMPLHKLARKPAQHVWLEMGHTMPPEDQRGTLIAFLQDVIK